MIAIKTSNLVHLKIAHDKKQVSKAYSSALRKTAGKTKTLISKKVRQTYNIKARDINSITRLGRVSQGVIITWTGTHVGLNKFSPLKRKVRSRRGPRVGVSVRIKKSNNRKLVKRGFRVKKLNNLVFQRNGKKMRSDPNRDAISRMYGISIPQMVNEKILNEAADFVQTEMPIQFERAFKFFVK